MMTGNWFRSWTKSAADLTGTGSGGWTRCAAGTGSGAGHGAGHGVQLLMTGNWFRSWTRSSADDDWKLVQELDTECSG